MVSYCIFFLPTHLTNILDYMSLKSEISALNLEMTALANDLLPIDEVGTIMANSNSTILLSTVTYIKDGVVQAYNGEALDDDNGKIVEYVVDSKGDDNYLLSYLSNYDLSYSSISLTGNGEIIVRIFCS